MEFKLKIEYNQILELIHQLPKDKLEKLVNTLQNELKTKKSSSKSKIEQLIVSAPTWSDEQLKDYQDTRDYINRSRIG